MNTFHIYHTCIDNSDLRTEVTVPDIRAAVAIAILGQPLFWRRHGWRVCGLVDGAVVVIRSADL